MYATTYCREKVTSIKVRKDEDGSIGVHFDPFAGLYLSLSAEEAESLRNVLDASTLIRAGESHTVIVGTPAAFTESKPTS